jgi:hypothetical protein
MWFNGGTAILWGTISVVLAEGAIGAASKVLFEVHAPSGAGISKENVDGMVGFEVPADLAKTGISEFTPRGSLSLAVFEGAILVEVSALPISTLGEMRLFLGFRLASYVPGPVMPETFLEDTLEICSCIERSWSWTNF